MPDAEPKPLVEKKPKSTAGFFIRLNLYVCLGVFVFTVLPVLVLVWMQRPTTLVTEPSGNSDPVTQQTTLSIDANWYGVVFFLVCLFAAANVMGWLLHSYLKMLRN